jgi:hypothetical protein
MKMMLNYLGTGYSFGIHRLAETFNDKTKLRRPVHILIVSDNDIFQILNETGSNRIGWDVAKEAIQICGGGGTYVLQLNSYYLQRNTKIREYLERMQQDGWSVAIVTNMTDLVQFARNFSHIQYHSKKKN